MKPKTKLWLRKKVLMALRAIVWYVDERLHAAEVELRDDIAATQSSAQGAYRPGVLRAATATQLAAESGSSIKIAAGCTSQASPRHSPVAMPLSTGKTLEEHATERRRYHYRRRSAAEFDAQFIPKRKDFLQ